MRGPGFSTGNSVANKLEPSHSTRRRQRRWANSIARRCAEGMTCMRSIHSIAFRLILAFSPALGGEAFAAGTVPGFSLTPQFDLTGKAMPGCRLNVIQAGTTSAPQNAYQDSGLTIPLPNPLICDSAGRLPAFFVADGLIKLRLTTSTGSQVLSETISLLSGHPAEAAEVVGQSIRRRFSRPAPLCSSTVLVRLRAGFAAMEGRSALQHQARARGLILTLKHYSNICGVRTVILRSRVVVALVPMLTGQQTRR
jgi:hypothetical protein